MSVRSLTVSYDSTTVLSRFELVVPKGGSVAVMGPSGSGKSSLLACITGTMVPTSGSVQVGDVVVSDLGKAARATFRRRHLGLVFQWPDLLPELSVVENVALTLLFDGTARRDALGAAREQLAQVGLAGHEDKRVDEISGGQAQRVALARALVRPEMSVLVADEPTASLDAANAARVVELLLARSRALGAAAIVATHDHTVAQACDQVVTLREIGLTETVR